MAIVFLDTEFTDLLQPELLSLGLVTLDPLNSPRELYVELDLATDIGRARREASSDFAAFGVLELWGLIPGSTSTEWEMGRRAGEWLLQLAAEAGTRIEIAFDYSTDYELLEYAIRDSGLWDQVRDVVVPVNVDKVTGTIDGELAAEECFRGLAKRGLQRHHALADALALRAAYVAVKSIAIARAADGGQRAAAIREVIDGTTWLTGEELGAQAEQWVREGRAFAVVEGEQKLYPAYQFGANKPLPVIEHVLAAFGTVEDAWALAAWFHCPNPWLVKRGESGATNMAPKDALERGDAVVRAAANRLKGYIA